MICICGGARRDGEQYCSTACATTARAASDELTALDRLMTVLALADELADAKRELAMLRELEVAVSDYVAIAVDAGEALARGDLHALRDVAEVRRRMMHALASVRRARGIPSAPPPMRAA